MATKPIRKTPQTNIGYWMNREEPRSQYSQQWHEYNLAQTSEKLMFMETLRDLCDYINIKQNKRRGRPNMHPHKMIFCMGLLIYAGKSSRRTISELHIAKDRGMIIGRVPHFNSILNYFNKEELKDQLIRLIEISSLPLKKAEQDFTVDSSGFSTSVFNRWVDIRYEEPRTRRMWRKAHVMSGVRTNVITSIQITQGSTADIKLFPDLVEATNKNFSMKEVSADMAYLSRDNLNLVSSKGAVPFIPFKSNSTRKSRGCYVWAAMYKYFTEHYDEFMQHYHKRSNAETVFSMIKRKFGMNLRTRNEVSQDNEILCKALCHNICVLIQEVFELGIDVDFSKYCANDNFAQKIPI